MQFHKNQSTDRHASPIHVSKRTCMPLITCKKALTSRHKAAQNAIGILAPPLPSREDRTYRRTYTYRTCTVSMSQAGDIHSRQFLFGVEKRTNSCFVTKRTLPDNIPKAEIPATLQADAKILINSVKDSCRDPPFVTSSCLPPINPS